VIIVGILRQCRAKKKKEEEMKERTSIAFSLVIIIVAYSTDLVSTSLFNPLPFKK
jgi:hypothetical protein